MPNVRWDEGSMRYMMCAFPLVGAVIGGLLCAWYAVADALSFGQVLYGAGLTLLPVAVTGGFHLDGFCDTADALASHAPPERKREILKDSHTGAFAVISLCAYMIAYFAFCCESVRTMRFVMLLGLLHILSRALSALASLSLPGAGGKGLLSTFRESAEKKRAAIVVFIECAVVIVVTIWFFEIPGAAAVFAGIVCLWYLKWMAKKQFGGMSGDLAGWFLQTAELVMLMAAVIAAHIVGGTA